jgi:NHLM bacteriocin system ABC transporter ATP-binding protein
MDFNIFDEQLNTRRQNDQRMFEAAFSDLVSVLGIATRRGTRREKEQLIKSALEKILGHYGATAAEVPAYITDLDARFEYMLRPTGIMRRRVELLGEWWKDANGAILASTKEGVTVAIMPGKWSGYGYTDPTTGKTIKINKETARQIEREGFSFYRPLPARALNLIDIGRYMMKSISLGDVLFVMAVSLVIALLGLFTPFINKQIFDGIIPSGIQGNILPIAILMVGVGIGTTIFGMTRNLLLTRFQDKTNFVQIAIMMRIFSLPTSFFKQYSAGELSSRVMSINNLATLLSGGVLTTGLTALFSFVYIFQMVNYAPVLVTPGLTVIGISLAYTLMTTLMEVKSMRIRMNLSAKLSGLVYALLNGVQKIKLAGAEKRAFAKWAFLYSKLGKRQYSPPPVRRYKMALSTLITMTGTLVLYFLAGRSGISAADYIAFSIAYGAVSSATMALGGIASNVASIRPLLEMARPIMATLPEQSENKRIVTALSGNFEVNEVTFRYDPDGPIIIDALSFKVRRGEYVAIVGKTGSGKSTLMRLLLGFEKPETGAIYYDGHDLESLDLQSTRQNIGVSLQNGRLFPGDIFSNIIVTAPWKTLDDAWEAARLAGVAQEIEAMPMGMHTLISEGSGGVSGGQRQRLLIARALVAKPKIIFFDEATSALDNVTQKHVAESLESLKGTRLVIAHRLSTIRHCDRIIVLDKGRCVEEGDFETLMARKGVFFELAKRQIL